MARKVYDKNIYSYDALGRKKEALESVESAYNQEWMTPGADSLDAHLREINLETLKGLRENLKNEIKLSDERDAEIARRREKEKTEADAERKAAIMADLRRGFAGSDDDFERLKDRLYDNYLINQGDTFQAAMDKARASGKYLI